jgi:molybdopterin-guanine dinucleotide biosynthesis protein A
MTHLDDVTLAVLAGGEGSRLGRPKAELQLDGSPILAWLLQRFDWPGPTMLVTAPGREHPPGCDRFVRELIDPQPGLGPLRGVLTALENLATPILVVTTVDMPGITQAHLKWYVEAVGVAEGVAGMMASRQHARSVEPFPSAYRTAARVPVSAALASRGSMRALGGTPGFTIVPAPDDWPDSTWINLNRLEDLSKLAQLGVRG